MYRLLVCLMFAGLLSCATVAPAGLSGACLTAYDACVDGCANNETANNEGTKRSSRVATDRGNAVNSFALDWGPQVAFHHASKRERHAKLLAIKDLSHRSHLTSRQRRFHLATDKG